MNLGDYQKLRDSSITTPGDHSWNYVLNALYTPIDMTEYEDSFVGFNEIQGALLVKNGGILKAMQEEAAHPQSN